VTAVWDEAVLAVDNDLASPRRARAFVGDRCTLGGVSTDSREVVVLLTSEVVTNVVTHACTPGTVRLTVGPAVVRVEVSDGSATPPRISGQDVETFGGRGLLLVDLLADGWGVDERPPGKVVWFEVRLPAPADRAP
jgi:anti-sigma regulatory factor (Ser/Thr protein kinase)